MIGKAARKLQCDACVKPLLLLSVIIATFAIPVARTRRPGPATYAGVFKPVMLFVAFYVFLLLFVYPRLS